MDSAPIQELFLLHLLSIAILSKQLTSFSPHSLYKNAPSVSGWHIWFSSLVVQSVCPMTQSFFWLEYGPLHSLFQKNSIPQGFCLTSASVISNIIKSRGFWRRTPGAYKWAGNAVLCKAVPWSRLYWTATVCQALSWEIQGSVLGIDRAWQEDQLQWVWPPGLHGIGKHRNKKGKTCISETR